MGEPRVKGPARAGVSPRFGCRSSDGGRERGGAWRAQAHSWLGQLRGCPASGPATITKVEGGAEALGWGEMFPCRRPLKLTYTSALGGICRPAKTLSMSEFKFLFFTPSW